MSHSTVLDITNTCVRRNHAIHEKVTCFAQAFFIEPYFIRFLCKQICQNITTWSSSLWLLIRKSRCGHLIHIYQGLSYYFFGLVWVVINLAFCTSAHLKPFPAYTTHPPRAVLPWQNIPRLAPRALLLTICIHHLLHLGIWGHDTPPTPVVADSKKNYSLRTLIDSHRSNIHLTLFMSQKLVVASVPISITVFSLGSIIIRKTGLRIDCRVVYIIFLSYLFLFFSCFTIQSKRFLFSQTQSGIVLMKYDDIVVNVLPAPFPGFFEVRVFVQMAYLNVFLSCRFNMQKKIKM